MTGTISVGAALGPIREAMRARDFGQARALWQRAHEGGRPDAEALAMLAAIAAEEGDLQGAAAALQRALAQTPERADLHANLGRTQLALGLAGAAVRSLGQAYDLDGANDIVAIEYASVLASNGRSESAAAVFRGVVARRPRWVPALAGLAFTALRAGRAEEAFEAAAAARAEGDDRVETRAVHGEAAGALGRWATAFECFQACAVREPGNPEYQASLAAAASRIGNLPLAQEASRRALMLRPYTVRGAAEPAVKVIVAEALPRGRFLAMPSRRRGYAGSNFPSVLERDGWQFVHAPVTAGSAAALAEAAASAHLILNNCANAEILASDPAAEEIARLAGDAGLPVLNPPEAVLATSRAANARRFADAGRFVFPETLRVAIDPAAPEAAARDILAVMAPPFILRAPKMHQGRQAFLIGSEDELAHALEAVPSPEVYLIRYHECRDERDFARRYRFAAVDGTLYTANMHVARDWNVHHGDRSQLGWSENGFEAEEARFLEDPASLIGGDPAEVFAEIVARTPLDIYGIDFGVDLDGRIVVFEVNASMAFTSDKLRAWPALMERRRVYEAAILDLMERRAVSPDSRSGASAPRAPR